jgi:hypothetical protein
MHFTYAKSRAAYIEGREIDLGNMANALAYIPDQVADDPDAFRGQSFVVRLFDDSEAPATISDQPVPEDQEKLLGPLMISVTPVPVGRGEAPQSFDPQEPVAS